MASNVVTQATHCNYYALTPHIQLPIVAIKDVAPHQVSVAWEGPDQLSVSYPSTAKLEDVYATVLGVKVVMKPQSGVTATGK